MNYFGQNIDVFGFGHHPIELKDHALDSYRFSIAIENMPSSHYMTEKICDVALGHSVPIYSGASMVNSFFDSPVPTIFWH